MRYILLIFIFSGNIFSVFAQKKVKIDLFHTLLTYKDKFYIITNDSTYETKDAVHWDIYPNKIDCKNIQLNYVDADSITYVFYDSGGNFYKFDGKNFKQLYFRGEHRNQHGAFKFLYKNKVHQFGGYGLFTEKNIITYFEPNTNEWDVVDFYNDYHDLPVPRGLPIAQVKGDELFIGFGDRKVLGENNFERISYCNDIWKFSFLTKKWTYLGEKTTFHNFGIKYRAFKNNTIIALEYEKTYLIDLPNNKLINYPNHASNRGIFDFVYNPHTDKFLLIDKDKDGNQAIKVVSSEELLGNKTEISPLYETINNQTHNIAVGAGLSIGLIILAYYLIAKNKRKLPIKIQIEKDFDSIMSSLEGEEIPIFKNIWDNYPNYVPYSQLMSCIDNKLSYDTQKKKVKTALDEIDFKIQEILKIEQSIFIYSKNEIDKRMKEVKIK